MKTKELVAIVAIITLLSSSVCLILQDDSYADSTAEASDVNMSEPYYIVTKGGISTTYKVPYLEINSNPDKKAYCLEDRSKDNGDGKLHDEYVSGQGGVMYSYYKIFDDDLYRGADIQFVIPEGTTLCLVNEFTTRDVRVEFGEEIGSISIYGGGSLDANPKDANTNGKRDEVGFSGVPTTISGITLLPAANSVVYGGSVTKDTNQTMKAVDLDSTNLTLSNVKYDGTTYAGSLAGNVGSSALTMIDMNITAKRSVFGGNAEAGHVGSTNVVFDGGNIDNIYGGGNKGTSCGSTNLNVIGGSVNTVYGGGSSSTTSHTFVHVGNDAEVTNHVFGGGYNGNSEITEVAVDGGSILGSVYGGCNSANVTEDAYITISGGEIGQGVLAGGSYGAVTNVANAHIAVTGGTIGYGVPSGDDTEADMTRGIFAAGGNAKNHGTVTNVEIVITGGTIYDVTESEAYNPDHPENIGKGEHAASPSSSSIRVSGGSFANDISDVITDGYVIQNADGSYSVSDNPPFIPGWDDDDEYIPPIVPVQPEDSGDDSVTVVACAAAAVVAALMAAFLILDRKR